MRPLDRILVQLQEELIESLAVPGRNGQYGIEVKCRRINCHDLQKSGLVNRVDFIDHEESGSTGLFDAFDQSLFLRTD